MADKQEKDFFKRIKAGEPIRFDDPKYYKFLEVFDEGWEKLFEINNVFHSMDELRDLLGDLIGSK